MTATPEQAAAHDVMEAAVKQLREAYGYDDGSIVTEWMLLTAARSWDDEGDSSTAIARMPCEPPPPWHHQAGMLRAAQRELEAM